MTNEANRHMYQQGQVVSLSQFWAQRANKLHRAIAEHGIAKQDTGALATATGMTPKDVCKARDAMVQRRSGDKPLTGADGLAGGKTLFDMMSAPGPEPDAVVAEAEAKERVQELIDSITPPRTARTTPARYAEVIRLCFGLGEEDEMTLGEVGERMGVSRERVRQLRDVALGQMRKDPRAAELFKAVTS
jgi:DNA-directed RNA polymerase sigma subunit (sigma70/sigma32)